MSKNIAIYSPGAANPVGHGFTYAYHLLQNFPEDLNISLFTVHNEKLVPGLASTGVVVIVSNQYRGKEITKSSFLRFGRFAGVAYGLFRIRYNYLLLKEYFNRNPEGNIYHLFEFEYFSTFIYFLLRPRRLSQTILGFHSADFCRIKGRSWIINAYKVLMKILLPFLVKRCMYSTLHGEILTREFTKNLRISKEAHRKKIISIPYGCNSGRFIMNRPEAKDKIGLDRKKIHGLFFGVLREDKGIMELLDVFQKMNDKIELVIAGAEGDIKTEHILGLIDRNEIESRVILNIKYLSEEEITDYFSACDFVFITHKNYHIAFSGPLSLAVEFQRPVVAADIAQIGYFVKKYGLGTLFSPSDYETLVPATEQLVQNLESYNDEGYFTGCIQENSWSAMSRHLEKLYRNE